MQPHLLQKSGTKTLNSKLFQACPSRRSIVSLDQLRIRSPILQKGTFDVPLHPPPSYPLILSVSREPMAAEAEISSGAVEPLPKRESQRNLQGSPCAGGEIWSETRSETPERNAHECTYQQVWFSSLLTWITVVTLELIHELNADSVGGLC